MPGGASNDSIGFNNSVGDTTNGQDNSFYEVANAGSNDGVSTRMDTQFTRMVSDSTRVDGISTRIDSDSSRDGHSILAAATVFSVGDTTVSNSSNNTEQFVGPDRSQVSSKSHSHSAHTLIHAHVNRIPSAGMQTGAGIGAGISVDADTGAGAGAGAHIDTPPNTTLGMNLAHPTHLAPTNFSHNSSAEHGPRSIPPAHPLLTSQNSERNSVYLSDHLSQRAPLPQGLALAHGHGGQGLIRGGSDQSIFTGGSNRSHTRSSVHSSFSTESDGVSSRTDVQGDSARYNYNNSTYSIPTVLFPNIDGPILECSEEHQVEREIERERGQHSLTMEALTSFQVAPPAQSVEQLAVAPKKTLFEKRALIVDDSAINRKFVNRLLRTKIGSRDEAEDGADAVEKVRQSMLEDNAYDVILMDYVMPVMDGPTATEKIR